MTHPTGPAGPGPGGPGDTGPPKQPSGGERKPVRHILAELLANSVRDFAAAFTGPPNYPVPPPPPPNPPAPKPFRAEATR